MYITVQAPYDLNQTCQLFFVLVFTVIDPRRCRQQLVNIFYLFQPKFISHWCGKYGTEVTSFFWNKIQLFSLKILTRWRYTKRKYTIRQYIRINRSSTLLILTGRKYIMLTKHCLFWKIIKGRAFESIHRAFSTLV